MKMCSERGLGASGRGVSVVGVPGLGLWENAEGQAEHFLWAASPMV